MTDTRPSTDPRLESAESLTAAIESGQRDAFLATFTANAVVWHNTDGLEQPVEAVLAGLVAIHERSTLSLAVDRRHPTDDGFVQAQRWRFTFSDGTAISFPSLFLARVEDGRITRLDEYVDGAALTPLAEALA
jgi:ketosteroid isomerase-like protein